MFGKMWTVAVAAVVAGGLALPAAYAQTSTAPATAPAAKPMTMKKPMAHKAHKMNCYDLAYQSAAMQDCLAKGGSATAPKPMMKKSTKKKTTS